MGRKAIPTRKRPERRMFSCRLTELHRGLIRKMAISLNKSDREVVELAISRLYESEYNLASRN